MTTYVAGCFLLDLKKLVYTRVVWSCKTGSKGRATLKIAWCDGGNLIVLNLPVDLAIDWTEWHKVTHRDDLKFIGNSSVCCVYASSILFHHLQNWKWDVMSKGPRRGVQCHTFVAYKSTIRELGMLKVLKFVFVCPYSTKDLEFYQCFWWICILVFVVANVLLLQFLQANDGRSWCF